MKKYAMRIMYYFCCLAGALFISWSGAAVAPLAACDSTTNTGQPTGHTTSGGSGDRTHYQPGVSGASCGNTSSHCDCQSGHTPLPQSENPSDHHDRPHSDAGCQSDQHDRPHSDSACHSDQHDKPRPDSACHSDQHDKPRPDSGCHSDQHDKPRPDAACHSDQHDKPRPDSGCHPDHDCCTPPTCEAVVEFDQPDVSVLENGISVIAHLVRNECSDGDVEVSLAYEDLEAILDEDYQAPVTTVFFSDGETVKEVEIIILNDAIEEIDESFGIQIVAVEGAQVGSQSEMTCTIIDDDEPTITPGLIAFADDAVSVNEYEPSITVELVRTDGSDGDVEVILAYSDLSATWSEDYDTPVTAVYFSDGETSKEVEILILDDEIVEIDEMFNIQIVDVEGAQIGPLNEITCTIIDDDEPPANPGLIAFADDAVLVNEYEPSITIELVRTDGNDGDVEVILGYTDLTATVGDDYNAPVTAVYFSDGETSKAVEILILDDDIIESDEVLNIQIIDVVGAQLGLQNEMTCTIIDDDTPPANPGVLSFAQEIIFVDEGEPLLNIEVVRTDGSDGTVLVDYLIIGDTATQDIDYQAIGGTLQFEDGETTKNFTITIVEDEEIEDDETIVLELINPVNATLGSPWIAEVTILDNDEVHPQ